ncbi:MAG: ABC transporter ATP-binding protein [Bacillota bacterium]
MIRFEHVKKTFPDGTAAIKDSSFDVKEGEFFVIIGPSGCGKTTTLKTINRLIPISDGTIFIQDKKISEYDINKLRWNIGYVLQQIALFPHLTIEENIAVVPELKKWSREDITNRVTELLNMVGLDANKYRKRLPHELSGGEQQRVGVVRALAADPDIILMDEPFSALDPISREKLQNDIQDLQKKIKKTIVFVTHDIREAVKLADRICLMQDGDIIQVGTPEDLLHNPVNDFVRTFTKSVQRDEDFDIQGLLETSDAKDAPKMPLETSVFELMRQFKTTETLMITKDNQTLGLLNKETFTDAFINHFEKGAV